MPQRADCSGYLTKRMKYTIDSVDNGTLPELQVRGKIAKNNNYQVCKSWVDFETKEFVYVVMINASLSEEKRVSFKDVCKAYHWKSFKFINNNQTIKPVRDPAWDAYISKPIKKKTKATQCSEPAATEQAIEC